MPTRPPAVVALLVCALACSAPAPQPAPVRWIRVSRPQVKERRETYPLSGTVVPQRAAQSLSFLVAGRVVSVGPREGEPVRKGQLLACLEKDGYAAAVDVSAAQSRAARAAEERAADELRRMQYLRDRESLAENDLLRFQLSANAAREQRLQAQAGERIARKSLSDACLRAIESGVVIRRTVEPGLAVAVGQPAYEVARLDPVEIQVGIPESLVAALHVGQPATVTLSAVPGETFRGTLRVVNAAADPASRTYMARIAVPNPDGRLRLGMVAEARIEAARDERALLVPYEAVVQDPRGLPVVFQFLPGLGRVAARRVVLGDLDDNSIQVRSGIDALTEVAIAGQQALRDGDPVRVEADQGAEPSPRSEP